MTPQSLLFLCNSLRSNIIYTVNPLVSVLVHSLCFITTCECVIVSLYALIVFVLPLGGASVGSSRPADMKDLLDLEHLQINDHASKASKAQVSCLTLATVRSFLS